MIALWWTGCASDGGPADTALPLDCAGYDWDTVGAPFVFTWCTPCHSPSSTDRHGAPEAVQLDTLAGVRQWLDRVEQRAVIERSMPPFGGPLDAEVEAFGTWIACGAPDRIGYQDAPSGPP